MNQQNTESKQKMIEILLKRKNRFDSLISDYNDSLVKSSDSRQRLSLLLNNMYHEQSEFVEANFWKAEIEEKVTFILRLESSNDKDIEEKSKKSMDEYFIRKRLYDNQNTFGKSQKALLLEAQGELLQSLSREEEMRDKCLKDRQSILELYTKIYSKETSCLNISQINL